MGYSIDDQNLILSIQNYWNRTIHDATITQHAPGTSQFFSDLDKYRFDKLRYLPEIVDFSSYKNQKLLEIGCGVGTDLVRFAKGGANVTGVDFSKTAISLAADNVRLSGVTASLGLANGEKLPFDRGQFDIVYAHGVIQYTANPDQLLIECRRVLKNDGVAIFMVYNRVSWLNALSKLMRVELEHEDAPILKKYSIREFREMLSGFQEVTIIPERFPVESKLHKGWKGFFFNKFFVAPFNLLPRSWVRRFGWHLMAFCRP